MQTVYILVNSFGILLGVYRSRERAAEAINYYQINEASSIEAQLMLYKVESVRVNTFAKNGFECVWMSNDAGEY